LELNLPPEDKVAQVPLLPLPALEKLTERTRTTFEEAGATYGQLRQWRNDELSRMKTLIQTERARNGEAYAELKDDLSWAIALSPAWVERNEQSLRERPVCGKHRARLRHSLRSDEAFEALLSSIHGEFEQSIKGWRRSDIFTVADAENRRARFPDYQCVKPGLSELRAFVQLNLERNPLFTALVTWCRIGNLHPFRDGNGRVSRIMFNLIISDGHRHGSYVPLYELGLASDWSLTIGMRRATLLGDWSVVPSKLAICLSLLLAVQAYRQ
jgi:hypothetical protein